ncbi:MAG: S1C family serine protease [Candidatus Nanopelagicales bacterium]
MPPFRVLVPIVLGGAVVLGLLLGILGGAAAGIIVVGASRGETFFIAAPSSSTATTGSVERAQGSVARMVESALPGVVSIAVDAGLKSGSGSGFVLRPDGYIVTNNHVISGAYADDSMSGTVEVVMADGRRLPATVVGRNVSYDIAVLSVDADGLTTLPLGDSDTVRIGDSVVAIGSPLGLDSTVTLGIVSALDRPVIAGRDGESSYISAIQTDAAINPGNSGGPLLDGAGRVIGVTSAIATLASGTGSIGLGFAIPVNAVQRIANELIDTGDSSTPIMGITLDTRFQGEGALINTVTPDGPAARAGVRPGDVVVKADGRPVANADEMVVAIRNHAPGETLEITVRRDGASRDFRVVLQGRTGP